MKKLCTFLILCCLLLTACAPGASVHTELPTQPVAEQQEVTQPEHTQTEPLPTQQEFVAFMVYWGNENADGLLSAEVQVREINAETVIAELVKAGAIPEGVAVNELTWEGDQLNIDFNEDFLNYL